MMNATVVFRYFRFRLLLPVLLSGYISVVAKPGFTELLYNPNWYRTFDSSSRIIPSEGALLFAWKFEDAEMRPDSFFVGIDTLWSLPQDVNSDTSEDWDLQVCPDEICMDGLKKGIHGANSPYPFGNGNFKTEHHFQFFPAIDNDFNFTSTPGSAFGAMMYCRSRSSGISDTVFAFGTWKLKWDPANVPPVRPVAGYLPKLSDFAISGDTIRYLKAGVEINVGVPKQGNGKKLRVSASPNSDLAFSFSNLSTEKQVTVFRIDGTRIWESGIIPASISRISYKPEIQTSIGKAPGFLVACLRWSGGIEWAKLPLLSP